jgi:hypothetical protein
VGFFVGYERKGLHFCDRYMLYYCD